jgi:hypothetical protein
MGPGNPFWSSARVPQVSNIPNSPAPTATFVIALTSMNWSSWFCSLVKNDGMDRTRGRAFSVPATQVRTSLNRLAILIPTLRISRESAIFLWVAAAVSQEKEGGTSSQHSRKVLMG